MSRFIRVLMLGLLLSWAVAAQGNSQRLMQLYRSGRWAEAVVLVKSLIAEHPEPTHLASIVTCGEATEMLRMSEWTQIEKDYFSRLDAEVSKRGEIPYEFECRGIKEQWVRFHHDACPETPSSLDLDKQNTARLKEVVSQQGWPKKSSWGERPAEAAWLILQHSPDYEFQAQMLPVLEKLLPEKECSAAGYALLYDRVQIRHGRPQRYGSQVHWVSGGWGPIEPLEEPGGLDSLRAEMGLQPMAEYLELISKMYGQRPRGWFR